MAANFWNKQSGAIEEGVVTRMSKKTARGGIEGISRTGWSLALSRLTLTWERFEIAAWPFVATLCLALALGVSGWLLILPVWAHFVVLLSVLFGLILSGVAGMRRFVQPSLAEAQRRLEEENNLEHHPLDTLQDRPSQSDPMGMALWREHQARTAARLGKLSVGAPKPGLAKADPFAFRLAAGFLLAIGLFGVGDRALENLKASLLPSHQSIDLALRIGVDAWLAPPDYTGLPPLFISRSSLPTSSEPGGTQSALIGEDHAAPVGSTLVVQVTGQNTGQDAGNSSKVELVAPNGRFAFSAFAAEGLSIEHQVTESGPISIEIDGQSIRSWNIFAMADAAPEIALSETPTATLRQALTIPFIVSDDYGVVSMRAEIERADRPAGSARSSAYDDALEKIVSPLPVPDRVSYGESRRVFRDYTDHPWAGGQVRLTLFATDALDQEGRSDSIEVTLPGREFNHPIARAIVEARRELAWDPVHNHTAVAERLRTLAWDTSSYGDDVTVFMALRETERRLEPSNGADIPDPANVAQVIDILWKTALFLEDGGISLALARLRAAEQALMDAIADGAEMSEIERLMDELQQAMNEYMDALTEQLAQQLRDGESPDLADLGDDANALSSQDMDQMMEQMREMMRNGDAQSAMQMLEQMRQMMENLQAGVAAQMSPEGREAMKLLEGMQDIMESQRELMDRTHRRAQEMEDSQLGQQGQPGDQESSRLDNQGQQGMSQQGLGQQGMGQQGLGQQGQDQRGRRGESGQGNGRNGQTLSPQSGQFSGSDAILQDALRRQLGEIMRQLGEMVGEIPEPFGRADEGMSDSTQSLRAGDPRQALGGQGRAMDALQDAADAARNAFMQQFQSPMSAGGQTPGQAGQQGRDPFGREPSENYQGPLQGEVTIPDENGVERSRQVRDELRRRSGERSRPQQELDYIDRLLDPFE